MESMDVEEEKQGEEQINSAYECMVCFEYCKQAVECLACHKLFCQVHVKNFQNKCPNCRSTPFNSQENIPIQKIIEELRKKLPIKCAIKDCGFKGLTDEFLQHAAQTHKKQIIKGLSSDNKEIYQLNSEYAEISKQMNILTQQIRRKSKAPNGEVKKVATPEQQQQMNAHVVNCQHEGCRAVWHGRWGPFIGGANGSTHFDLTECAQGKQLNQDIGWNYNDPRH